MQKLKNIILLALVSISLNANAKTNMAVSIDWSIAKADYIITGEISEIKRDIAGICTVTVNIAELLKGPNALTNNGIVTFTTTKTLILGYHKTPWSDTKNITAFLKWDSTKTHLELFDDHVDGFSYKHFEYTLLDNDINTHKVITAGFDVLEKGADVVSYIKKTITAYPKKEDAYIFEKVDIPFDTKAHGLLYAGSMCYLGIPVTKPEPVKDMVPDNLDRYLKKD